MSIAKTREWRAKNQISNTQEISHYHISSVLEIWFFAQGKLVVVVGWGGGSNKLLNLIKPMALY